MISQTRNKFCFAAVLTIFTHGIHYFVLDINPWGSHSELLWHAAFTASEHCAPCLMGAPDEPGIAAERGTCLAYHHENQAACTFAIVKKSLQSEIGAMMADASPAGSGVASSSQCHPHHFSWLCRSGDAAGECPGEDSLLLSVPCICLICFFAEFAALRCCPGGSIGSIHGPELCSSPLGWVEHLVSAAPASNWGPHFMQVSGSRTSDLTKFNFPHSDVQAEARNCHESGSVPPAHGGKRQQI